MRSHPFADSPQYAQQYGNYPLATSNGLGACEALDAPDALHFDTDSATGLPYGWSVYEGGVLLDGYDRSETIIENEDEIRALFTRGEAHRVGCGYCGESTRRRNAKATIAWFHSHDCNADEFSYAVAV